MSFTAWTTAVGVLLVGISLASGWIRRLPMTHFAVYLAVGIGVGPWGLHLLDIDFLRDAAWLERLTEIALIVSLFTGGLKLRVPWRTTSWRVALRLAFPAMFLSIAATTAVAYGLLPLDWPQALLLAAALAPTDPVLASTVAVDNASDRDGLRVALSAEAGFNDGSAMPFLLLALALLQHPFSWALVGQWALVHLLWGVLGGFALGFGLGWAVGWASTRLRVKSPELAPGGLLALGLIALTYGVAQGIGVLGFIAVFAAGLGMRRIEVHVMQRQDGSPPPPAESLLGWSGNTRPGYDQAAGAVGKVLADALTLGSILELLLAPLLVLLIGIAVARHWTLDGVWVMLPLFFVIRPLTTWLVTVGMGLDWRRRLLLGWLGIRGIGGLNYVAYALVHGLVGSQARVVAGVTITVITLSVVLHGFSAQPLLAWRQRLLQRSGASPE